jgi:AraC-like DNA-binding protein
MENYSHEQIQYQPETGMLFEIYDTDGFFNSKHWHNGLEIIYLIAGGMTLNICESNYMLKPGGFIVVNSKTIHSVICREKGRHLLLQIPYEILEKSISNIDIIKFNCYSAPAASDGNGNNAGVRETLEKLKSLFEAPRDDGYILMFNSLVYELLYKLVKGFKSSADPALKKKTDRNIQRLGVVLQYARQHYAENITLQDAAEAVALNREYFARFFRKYMGMTFMEYVFAIRLEHVYYDIANTDYTIGSIADKHGFCHNYKLFVKKFKEQYGCSPGEVRKRSRKDE